MLPIFCFFWDSAINCLIDIFDISNTNISFTSVLLVNKPLVCAAVYLQAATVMALAVEVVKKQKVEVAGKIKEILE